MKAKIFVPASIGNVGPGFDTLGLAIEGLGDTFEVELHDGPDEVVQVSGIDKDHVPKDPSKNVSVIAAQKLLAKNNLKYGVKLTIERQLPISGGLGSSAAASVGGALAAGYAADIIFNQKDILEA